MTPLLAIPPDDQLKDSGGKVAITPAVIEDAAGLFAVLTENDLKARQFLVGGRPATEDEMRATLEVWETRVLKAGEESERFIAWTLRRMADDEIVGIAIARVLEGNWIPELTMLVRRRDRCLGIGAEALGLVLRVMFSSTNVRGFVGVINRTNDASKAMVSKLGFNNEGPANEYDDTWTISRSTWSEARR